MPTQSEHSKSSDTHTAPVKRIVALGDSLTWGYPGTYKPGGANGILRRSAHAWPAQLAEALSLEVINAGTNGDPLGGMITRLQRDVLAHKPQLVIVTGGSNDAAQGLEIAAMQDRVMRLRDALQDAQIQVVWGIPPSFVTDLVLRYWSDAGAEAVEQRRRQLDNFRDWLRRWAPQQIDFAQALREDPRPLAELLPDGIHPSDETYDLMAATARDGLQQIL